MISLKRYLDSQGNTLKTELLAAMLDAYRSALTAMGICAVQACPSAGPGLQRTLTGLGQELENVEDPATVVGTDARVTQELQQWGDLAQASLEQKTRDIKELLVVVARTAATITTTDQRYAKRFDAFTARLERIANLEDLGQLRTSIVRSAAELKTCVEEMSQNARDSVAQLQAEVVTYQVRLEEVEQLAARDPLTGLFNRGKLEAHIENRIAGGRPFSVAIVDLDGFKSVNDRFGHAAGDDLLKQFSTDLRSNARPADQIGRWGGDEFIIVLDCGLREAQTHVERIEKWVVGDYTVAAATGPQKVRLNASIGLAEWSAGRTAREVLERADAMMYKQKSGRR